MTYMIEGAWNGYRPEQERVVHRAYTTNAKFADKVKALGYGIRYTDGTVLMLNVTEAPRGKRPPAIDNYGSLIRDCVQHGTNSVAELQKLRNEAARTPGEVQVEP